MNERLKELYAQQRELLNECAKYPWVSYDDPLFEENHDEWFRLNDLHEQASKKFLKWWKKNHKEIDQLVISENQANGVYWDRQDWIYDVVKGIKQHYELKGQERTARFIQDLEKINGVVVTECDAGYDLEIFTPYKVYMYRFNRGYGDYPITIKKGFIAPYGNVYKNKVFLASSAKDMKARYFENE